MIVIWFTNIDPQSLMFGLVLGFLVGLSLPDAVRWVRAVTRRRWGHHGVP